MFSRKSVGSRMEPWGTFCDDFNIEPLEAVY